MFDQVVTRPPRRTIKTVLLVGSAVIHAVVVAVVVVAGMWQVDLLPLGPERVDIALNMPKPPSGAAELPAGKAQNVIKPAVIKVKPQVVVQPELVKPEVTETGPTGAIDGMTTGGGGNGPKCRLADDHSVESAALPECPPPGTPPCKEEPCSDDGDPPVVVVEKKDERTCRKPGEEGDHLPPCMVNVRPDLAKGMRLSGDEQVFPPRLVQLEMVRAGKDSVRGTFKLCVDEDGRVSDVRVLGSTGYDAYDAELVRAMRGWRYRPYMVGGAPTSMCTVQIFVYSIKD